MDIKAGELLEQINFPADLKKFKEVDKRIGSPSGGVNSMLTPWLAWLGAGSIIPEMVNASPNRMLLLDRLQEMVVGISIE